MEGTRLGKLYRLSMRAEVLSSQANIVHTDVKASEKLPMQLWHDRMAYVNTATI
jgi:hypothetical protein